MQEKHEKNIHISEFSIRFQLLIEALGVNYTEFAEKLDIGKGRLSNIIAGRNNPDATLLANISKIFTNVNNDWLLSGEGDIFKKKIHELEEIGEIRDFSEKDLVYKIGQNQFIDMGGGRMQMFVPLVEQYAYAGYLSGWSDPEYIEELPKISIIVDKHHLGTYRSFTVRGDSMNDNTRFAICEGDVAVGRKIEKQYWTSKLHLKKWQAFAIVHEEGIIIKEISEHDVENGIITCVSLNPDKDFYPTKKVHLKDVYELYNITNVIRNY